MCMYVYLYVYTDICKIPPVRNYFSVKRPSFFSFFSCHLYLHPPPQKKKAISIVKVSLLTRELNEKDKY